MTVLLKPTCCPASPCSFNNDLPRFTSLPLGLQQREPWQIVARIQRQYPTNKNILMLVSPSLHIPPGDRFFSPPIIEMILVENEKAAWSNNRCAQWSHRNHSRQVRKSEASLSTGLRS